MTTVRLPQEVRKGSALDDYVILDIIGSGGQANILSAWDNRHERVVAIKLMPVGQSTMLSSSENFEREATIISDLSHPNVLPLFSFRSHERFRYISMQYICSGSLQDLLEDGPLSMVQTLQLTAQIASALDYIHRQSIVHRDLKAGNILVDTQQHAFLTDFGLARDITRDSGILHTGHGTAPYAPPEQHTLKPITVKTDIYSLGIMIYVMLVGDLPWEGAATLALQQIESGDTLPDPTTRNPSLPATLAAALGIITAPTPSSRPDTATEALHLVIKSLRDANLQHVIESAGLSDTFDALGNPLYVYKLDALAAADASHLMQEARQTWSLLSGIPGFSYTHYVFVNGYYMRAEKYRLALPEKSILLLAHSALIYNHFASYWWHKITDDPTRIQLFEQILEEDDDNALGVTLTLLLTTEPKPDFMATMSPDSMSTLVEIALGSSNAKLRQDAQLLLKKWTPTASRWVDIGYTQTVDQALAEAVYHNDEQSETAIDLIAMLKSKHAVNTLLSLSDEKTSIALLDQLHRIQTKAGSLPANVPARHQIILLIQQLRKRLFDDQITRPWIRMLIGAGIGLIFTAFMLLNIFGDWNLRIRDILYQPYTTSGIVTLVQIDDKSLDAFGRWESWPRSLHGQLIQNLTDAGAKTIVLDYVFASYADDDNLLEDVLSQTGNVVQPVLPVGDAFLDSPGTTRYLDAVYPLPELRSQAVALGHTGILHDPDGLIRRLPVVIDVDGEQYPSISVAAIQAYLGLDQTDINWSDSTNIEFAGRTIPVDPYSSVMIHYAGEPLTDEQSVYQTVSYVDIINGTFDQTLFDEKIVLVGITATGEPDRYLTPVGGGRPMYGVEILANTIETIWSGRHIQVASNVTRGAILLVLCVSIGIIASRPWQGLGLSVVIVIGYFILISALFDQSGLILDILYPILAIATTYVTVTAYRYSLESRQRQQIMQLFEARVTPEVARATLEAVQAGSVQLGGEVQEVSILFADIRGYTNYSENRDPRDVMTMVNTFMTIAAEGIFSFEGTLANYEGDQAMAIYNAPLSQPDHAIRAVRTAVEIRNQIRSYQNSLSADHPYQAIQFGFGVYTGKAIVGYTGSAKRYEYTALGDTVNVAARLTGMAEPQQILIGETTYEQVSENILADALAPIIVKGKSDPVPIFNVESIL